MKQFITIFLAAILTSSIAKADFYFSFNRFGWIELKTLKGSERIIVTQASKFDEEIIYKSKLSMVSKNVYKTADGVTFTVTKLKKPVVNDGNRGINSGAYKLEVTATKAKLKELREKIPEPTFSKHGAFTYFGRQTK